MMPETPPFKKFQPGDAIAAFIDHTLLKPTATPEQIEKLCAEAEQFQFAAVCVNPVYVPLAVNKLKHTAIPVASVIGFPLGANATMLKAAEARQALADGASEFDMVINLGYLKAGANQLIIQDIAAVVHAVGDKVVKVIIETCLLTEEEKKRACELARQAGAQFVKTSTGFSTGGATAEDVRLMRQVVGETMGVKAAGGIRTLADALSMLNAGANRLGTSAGVQIVRESRMQESAPQSAPVDY